MHNKGFVLVKLIKARISIIDGQKEKLDKYFALKIMFQWAQKKLVFCRLQRKVFLDKEPTK